MPGLFIDRLSLQIPNMPEGEARRLALEVAGGLANSELPPRAREWGAMRVDLRADLGQADHLAESIVSEILAQLQR